MKKLAALVERIMRIDEEYFDTVTSYLKDLRDKLKN